MAGRAAERARRIGERIRAMRLEAGLTPAAPAEKVGVPRHVVAGLEAATIEGATIAPDRLTTYPRRVILSSGARHCALEEG